MEKNSTSLWWRWSNRFTHVQTMCVCVSDAQIWCICCIQLNRQLTFQSNHITLQIKRANLLYVELTVLIILNTTTRASIILRYFFANKSTSVGELTVQIKVKTHKFVVKMTVTLNWNEWKWILFTLCIKQQTKWFDVRSKLGQT